MGSPKPIAIRVVVAGGGTGGHLFPGIAIAQEVMRRNPNNRVLFIGTDKPFEAEAVARAGFAHRFVSAEGIKGRGLWRSLRAGIRIPVGLVQAMGILYGFKPDLVLGVGGVFLRAGGARGLDARNPFGAARTKFAAGDNQSHAVLCNRHHICLLRGNRRSPGA